MTLVTRRTPPAHHRKVSARHHRYTKDYHKAYWPYLPLLAIVIVGAFLNSAWPGTGRHSVLAYATDMSGQELLDDTNAQRNANGLASLTLNGELVNAAQNKANDMIAQDYWSHDNPEGETPWQFITAAGYSYETAGENLAYGFDTSADTITAWMNSADHRANILNTTYEEVGFGIANGANYQGSGQETVVVAEYAEPISAAAPAPTPAASTPKAPSSTPTTSTSASPAPTPAATPATTTPAATPTTTKPSTTGTKAASATTPTQTQPQSQQVARIQLLTDGDASWSLLVTTLIIAAALMLFLVRHGLAWHRVIRRGERFVLKHQLLDVIAVSVAVLGFILTRSSGVIR